MKKNRLPKDLEAHYKKQKELIQDIEEADKENNNNPHASRDLQNLSPETVARIADAHPLAVESVSGMDVSHHQGKSNAPQSAEYVGHFYVNQNGTNYFVRQQVSWQGLFLLTHVMIK